MKTKSKNIKVGNRVWLSGEFRTVEKIRSMGKFKREIWMTEGYSIWVKDTEWITFERR